MSRFSKLKKEIEKLFDPSIGMEFCCSAYPMRSKTGYATRSITRFYVKIGRDIIWDFPKDFEVNSKSSDWCSDNGISALVREYIDTPVAELLDKAFSGEFERRGCIITYSTNPNGERVKYVIEKTDHEVVITLTDIFKAADRRIGKKKLMEWFGKDIHIASVTSVLQKRFTTATETA